jgi:hypothetical protein
LAIDLAMSFRIGARDFPSSVASRVTLSSALPARATQLVWALSASLRLEHAESVKAAAAAIAKVRFIFP